MESDTVKRKIILASASPRRRELLAQIDVEFEVRVSDKEEIYHSCKPEEIVKELALMKAENVAADLAEETRAAGEGNGELRNVVVIGADTVVVLDGQILGKPKDEEDAADMLSRLQGRAHEVYTGTAILDYDEEGRRSVVNQAVRTEVHVHAMEEAEIRRYIATGEPMDKAGAYGIQGRFAAFIDQIEGNYYNVVGLPVSSMYQELKKAGAL
ncbi:MAG TPA: septum formation inhibitor Maf [Candidatus Mediterraneibacter stercoripullorum]|nr:septum formation inhibitor Maf [Candidatus Mediterraneibacter stercoripullorum]